MRRRALASFVALCALWSCTCNDTKKGGAPAASGSASPVALAPLEATAWRVELPVPGFAPASVAVPLGATRPRPIVVAIHGRSDRPEWQCGTWRGIVGGHVFVMCPRGKPAPGERFTWSSAPDLAAELKAGLAALKQRFGAHVAPGSVVLIAHGLGADLALDIVRQEPAFFSRLVLIEGGHAAWSATLAGVFARGRGDRVVFACGTSDCAASAERAALFASRAGALGKPLLTTSGAGVDGALLTALRGEWPWVVEGDPRFAAP